jgi:hypothetical protein
MIVYLSGDAVDNLQAYWGQAVKTTSSRLEGGSGGQPWSDESPHGNFPIQGIRINFGDDGINRIQACLLHRFSPFLPSLTRNVP